MAEPKHIEVLNQGVTTWNQWRTDNPGVRPQLSGEDLSDMDLAGINLSEADLCDAELFHSNLRGANLKMAAFINADLGMANLRGAALYKADLSNASLIEADLSEAGLGEADLSGADLRGTTFERSDLTEARLAEADLGEANLTHSILVRANIVDTSFRNANLASTNLTGLEHGNFRSKRGNFYGIRGLDSCYGNALFVRDAKDQDYLDTLENSIEDTASPGARAWKRFWFSAWGLIDYGRSLARTFLFAFVMAMAFGIVYYLDGAFGWGLLAYPPAASSPLSPFYYSIVTYTKLGFGYMTPTHWIGEILLVCEGVLGYITLGLLLSILANRVARRS
jgi:uncharacterized protein YjbI with pentapeptide repeats